MSNQVKHASDSLRIWIGRRPFEAQGLFDRVEPVEVFHVVLDSSVIQHDLRYLVARADRVRAGLRTALLETIDSGVVVAYVPPEAIEEIEKYLPRIASDKEAELSDAAEVWTSYQRRLLVLPPIRAHHHAELEKRDVKDMPFLAVFREASGDMLLSADKHLLDTLEGATTADSVVGLLRDYTREKAVALGASGQIYAGAALVSYGGLAAFRIVKTGVAAFKRLPFWAQMGVVIGGIALAQRPAVKSWLSERWTELSDATDVVFPRLLAAAADAGTAEQSAMAKHAELSTRLRRTRRLGLRAALIRVARDAGVELSINELAKRMKAIGYKTTARRCAGYLERQLRRDPMFEETPRGWRLIAAHNSKM